MTWKTLIQSNRMTAITLSCCALLFPTLSSADALTQIKTNIPGSVMPAVMGNNLSNQQNNNATPRALPALPTQPQQAAGQLGPQAAKLLFC